MTSVKKTKNYFFVSTGLQILNAIEYVFEAHLESDENILIVVSAGTHNVAELESLIGQFKWSKVHYLPPRNILGIKNINLRFLLTFAYSYTFLKGINFKSSGVILGNDLNPYFRYTCRKARGAKIVFIDDGSGSVHYSGDNPYLTLRGIKHKWLYKVLKIHNYDIVPTVFFSAFPLQDYVPLPGQQVINNSYRHLCADSSSKPIENVIYFIGDPIVERGYISLKKYLKSIQAVKDHFGTKVIYIPRMSETSEILEAVSKIVDVQVNKVPFELFIVTNPALPYLLIGYHSTVLFNVNKIYGDLIKYHYIKLPDFTAASHFEKNSKIWSALDKFALEFKPDFSDN